MIEATGGVRVEKIRPSGYGLLDQTIHQGHDSYRRPLKAERHEWIFESVRHHLAASPAYRRLAEASGFSLEECELTGELDAIPLLSSGSFKRRLFDDDGEGIKQCSSSGTMGTKSLVPRDPRTLERFAASMLNGAREFLAHDEDQVALILGPPPEEAGDLWFAYSLGLAEIFHEADYFVADERFEPARLYATLSARDPADRAPVIGAPPSLVAEFCEWMEETGAEPLALAEADGWLVTAGGWKTADDEKIDAAVFRGVVRRQLGLAPEHIRDVFNMVELNTAIFECEAGAKHVPPWLEATARDGEDLAVLPPGKAGILAYLDPTPLSYPGFVLSDDIGYIGAEDCPCGRVGKTVFPQRRLKVVEERGCGRKMDRYGKGDPR